MTIAFTQHVRPNGIKRICNIHIGEDVKDKAKRIIDAGFILECEVLKTDEVSFTIADGEKDIAIEICSNGPDVLMAIRKLIIGFQLAGDDDASH